MKKNFKTIITLLLCIIIILGICIFVVRINDEKLVFKLYGENEITLYEGDLYNEPGFIALDKKENQVNDRVVIESDLDTNKVGEYTIKYTIDSTFKDYVLKRKVTVLYNPLKNVNFSLKGSKVMNISLNEEFNDPLYTCINNETNSDLSNIVTIDNQINNQVIGTYVVNYIATLEGAKKVLTRTVNVLEKKYEAILSNNEPTNQDVIITFNSNIENFSYIITPEHKIIYEKTHVYTASENGKYSYVVYDDENNFEEHIIEITNIDKEAPIINACSSYIENNKTYFKIDTTSTDIVNYKINGSQDIKIEQFPYTFDSIVEITNLVASDSANNETKVDCSFYYVPINPKGTETIKQNVSTDTLKVWIEQKTRSKRTSYYITHIWALNPYNQFKSQVPNKFGSELVRPKTLLANASKDQNLSTKLAVGVNASGFVKNGTWGQKYYDANKKYNLTSQSPLVVVNGKTLRDLTGSKLPSGVSPTYGLKKDGNFAYYSYPGKSNITENQATAQKILNDGVLNTFSFSPVLVTDGKVVATNTDKNIRQGLCQIDKNNFVFITDVYNSSRNGFSHKELGEYMVSIGCKTGFNLDGGGSVALIFKNKNSDPVTITGNDRSVADIVYFHE